MKLILEEGVKSESMKSRRDCTEEREMLLSFKAAKWKDRGMDDEMKHQKNHEKYKVSPKSIQT